MGLSSVYPHNGVHCACVFLFSHSIHSRRSPIAKACRALMVFLRWPPSITRKSERYRPVLKWRMRFARCLFIAFVESAYQIMVNHHEGKHDDGFRRHTSRITSHLSSSDLLPLRGRKGGGEWGVGGSAVVNSISLSLSLCHTRERLPGGAFNCRMLKNACVRVCVCVFFFPTHQSSRCHLRVLYLNYCRLLLHWEISRLVFVFRALIIIAPHYNTHTHTQIFLPWLPHQDEMQPNKRSAATCCRYGAKLMRNFSAN